MLLILQIPEQMKKSVFQIKGKLNLEQLQLNLSDDEYDSELTLTITDEFLNSVDLAVSYGERSEKIYIVENQQPIEEVKETDIVNELDQQISYDQLRFDSFVDEIVWIKSINKDSRKFDQSSSSSSSKFLFSQPKVFFQRLQSLKASVAPQLAEIEKLKVKRRRLDESTELLTLSVSASIPVVVAQNAIPHYSSNRINSNWNPINVSSICNSRNFSFSLQFEEKFKEYAKFKSEEEEIVARKFVLMMEGVCISEMKKFDENAIVIQPIERQLLFKKVEQKPAHQLHGKLVDGYKLSLLATGEAWKVREQLNGAFSKFDILEIYSETTKLKMAENKKLIEGNFRMSRFSSYRQNQMKWVFMNLIMKVSNQRSRREIFNGRLKGFRFGRKWKDNNTKLEMNSEEADDKVHRI
ncbi:MAG: hypothetical protein EZS28_014073 [Streblomastix strix]|uniref:Uncharacterized protein n=1 Tax=Streblomastix strix TaxID=222440 RepID=A0A5J4W6J9_9EUKA|nr:MAG: hypothetical protein EZS28_014073 [Streblomastix strix]